MRGKNWKLALILSALVLVQPAAFAQTKRIVTYIEDVQEERKSTRWTLTEWLRIKERMKMMDVWLAMFSKPQEKFAPEISFGYVKGVGEAEFSPSQTALTPDSHDLRTMKTEEARLQFWFTNLVSGTTGLRTLNIDIGLEGKVRNRFLENKASLSPSGAEEWKPSTQKLSQAGVNLRLFGASSQDSGLVVKGGKFERESGFTSIEKSSGTYFGGELSLYFLSFLGAEGTYYQYRDANKNDSTSIEGMGFLEIYNVRVGYGQARRDWDESTDLQTFKTKELERFLTVRLYF